jgi:hypothetical protein
MALLRQLAIIHLGHGTSSGATAAGASGAGTGAGAGATGAGATGAAAGATGAGATGATVAGTAGGTLGGTGGLISAGAGAMATKTAGALAAAAIVTAGAVEATHASHHHGSPVAAAQIAAPEPVRVAPAIQPRAQVPDQHLSSPAPKHQTKAAKPQVLKAADKTSVNVTAKPVALHGRDSHTATKVDRAHAVPVKDSPTGRVQTQTDPTVLASPSGSADTGAAAIPRATGAPHPPTTTADTATTPASSGTTGPTGPTGATPPATDSSGTSSTSTGPSTTTPRSPVSSTPATTGTTGPGEIGPPQAVPGAAAPSPGTRDHGSALYTDISPS